MPYNQNMLDNQRLQAQALRSPNAPAWGKQYGRSGFGNFAQRPQGLGGFPGQANGGVFPGQANGGVFPGMGGMGGQQPPMMPPQMPQQRPAAFPGQATLPGQAQAFMPRR